MIHQCKSQSVSQFCNESGGEMHNLLPFLKSQLQDVERLDVVWDQYIMNSLKQQVRMTRGEGSRRRVLDNTTIPKNWANFLYTQQ